MRKVVKHVLCVVKIDYSSGTWTTITEIKMSLFCPKVLKRYLFIYDGKCRAVKEILHRRMRLLELCTWYSMKQYQILYKVLLVLVSPFSTSTVLGTRYWYSVFVQVQVVVPVSVQ